MTPTTIAKWNHFLESKGFINHESSGGIVVFLNKTKFEGSKFNFYFYLDIGKNEATDLLSYNSFENCIVPSKFINMKNVDIDNYFLSNNFDEICQLLRSRMHNH